MNNEKDKTTSTDDEGIFAIPVDVEVIHDAVVEKVKRETYEKYNRYREVTCPACGATVQEICPIDLEREEKLTGKRIYCC